MSTTRYAIARDGEVNPRTVAATEFEVKRRGLYLYFDTIVRDWPEGLVDDVWAQWLWRLSVEEPEVEMKIVEVSG